MPEPTLTRVAVEDLTDGTYLFVGQMRSTGIWEPGPIDVGSVVVKGMATGHPMIMGFGDFRKLSSCSGQWFRIECPPEVMEAERRKIDLAFLEYRLKERAWWVKNPPTWDGFEVTRAMLANVLEIRDKAVEERLINLYFEVRP